MKTILHIILAVFFAGAVVFTAWSSLTAVNYSEDSAFYRDYLIKWEKALRLYVDNNPTWPRLPKEKHVDFMESVITLMNRQGIEIPISNTSLAYTYRIRKVGVPESKIFILCLPDKLVVFGISEETFNRLDAFIDSEPEETQGWFTGHSTDDGKYVGIWYL